MNLMAWGNANHYVFDIFGLPQKILNPHNGNRNYINLTLYRLDYRQEYNPEDHQFHP
jgi:hypothetical protein